MSISRYVVVDGEVLLGVLTIVVRRKDDGPPRLTSRRPGDELVRHKPNTDDADPSVEQPKLFPVRNIGSPQSPLRSA